jgi:hypothetical protein
MLHPLIRTLVKVVVASLIVGTILNHFGITPEQIVRETGLSYDKLEDGPAAASPGLYRTRCSG